MMKNDRIATSKQCLNGWWDFIPLYTPATDRSVPRSGWNEGQYLVPSFWTKPDDAVRKKGDKYFKEAKASSCTAVSAENEYLFDAFGYPEEWSKTRAGWVRRNIVVSIEPGRRYVLLFEAAMPRPTLYVNGKEVARHVHPTLPFEADVTAFLKSGNNEIALLIEDYEYDGKHRTMVPSGNWIPCRHSGLWQDCWLLERPEVYASDIRIRTSVREKTIGIRFEFANASGRDRKITVCPAVVDWQKGADNAAAQKVLEMETFEIEVPAGKTVAREMTVAWKNPVLWNPENPKLYQVRIGTEENGAALETVFERFGFREVWIDGPAIMLNGYPLHAFSDWGHKTTPYYYTEGWIRRWFGMIKGGNMNHSRLHTHPHPQICLRLADEEGILITGEAGLHGSGGEQASDSPGYWEAAADHIRRFVARDKNHPCIVLWSVENEMRWNGNATDLTKENLPKLRKLFNELDPTRPAYHEGDSSLWNEKQQDIISRHYGKECAGAGWWDQKQPLHCGEMSLYHYACPPNTAHLAGDAGWADFKAVDEAAAHDTRLIIEAGRTLGVSCFGPWNLSCLENLRMHGAVKLKYKDYSVPGVKPLQVAPHSSEFTFWKKGKGYTPNYSFAIQQAAFRPLAVIDKSLRSQYYAGMPFTREVFVVNDTASKLDGTLEVSLKRGGKALLRAVHKVSVQRGHCVSKTLAITIPKNARPGVYEYIASFKRGSRVMDRWSRKITIAGPAVEQQPAIPGGIAVFGPGLLKPFLAKLGVGHHYIDSLHNIKDVRILLMEKNTVLPAFVQNAELRQFVQSGGRLVMLEQTNSLFQAMPMLDRPAQKLFPRSFRDPLLDGIGQDGLFMWGDDAYPLFSGDAYVASKLYKKDNAKHARYVLDTGDGGFGYGDLDCAALLESAEGEGLIIACQARVTDKLADIPAARTLLLNMLKRADAFTPRPAADIVVVEHPETCRPEEYIRQAEKGGSILINNASPKALARWGKSLKVALKMQPCPDIYQLVRVKDDVLLNGVSNEDTCGIESFPYAPRSVKDNLTVGSCCMARAKGLEALLETPVKSALAELFVQGGSSEPLRAHTFSRFLRAERPKPAVGLGVVRKGKGLILFNQFNPPAGKRTRFERLANRLLANLGQSVAGSLLDFDPALIRQQKAASPGFPQKVFVFNAACTPELKQEFIENTFMLTERMYTPSILNIPGWKKVESESGEFSAAGLDASKDIYIYYPVNSPSVRKTAGVGLNNVPNPEALTFLDFEGEGTLELILNGAVFAAVKMEGGKATVSDLTLELGFNKVLVRWVPESAGSKLKMRWRNIMHQPETGLKFEA